MQYVKLNSGEKIPQLGLGVFQTPDGAQTANAVKWALEAGYRHIDTARFYGNEQSVGDGLRESGVARQDIFLTTKLWNDDVRKRRAKEAFAESLAALQTDYVDLYLIHWPVDGFEQAWADMEELYAAGKIKSIGVSNFNQSHLERLAAVAKVRPAINQIESHPYFNNQALINACFRQGIAVEVWSPLGGNGSNLLKDEVLGELARKYGRSTAQIVLRWDIQRNVVVIPKSAHRERIVSNMALFDFELSEEDMRAIDALDKNQRVGPDPDHVDF